MKSYDEVTNNLLERRDKYNEVQRAKKKTIVRISSFVSCFVIVAILGIGIWQGGWLDFNSLPIVNPSTQEGGNTNSTNTNITQENTTNQTTIPSTEQPTSIQNTEAPPDGGSPSDGNIGGWFMPTLPSDREIKVTGEVITDAEAKEYFSKNQNSIISSLASTADDFCMKLISRTNSAAITSVIVSMVIAYPQKLFKTACCLLQTKEIFQYDLENASSILVLNSVLIPLIAAR